jgi:glutaredoxin
MDIVTLYVTQSSAVRKTADDCRRIIALFDALRVKYKKETIDTKEMMTMIAELSGSKQLPQCFVGDQFLGNYDKVFELNEKQLLAGEFRRLGYAGEVVGGENIPVASVEPQKVTKKVVVKKKVTKKKPADGNAEDDGDAPPPPPDSDEDDGDAPPPPPDSDEDGGNGDEGAPPPPPDEDPPPPPDDDE